MVLVTRLEKIGISDVRSVIAQAQLRPTTSAGQVVVLATSFITNEAQNALLKLLEEPPDHTSFVLVVPIAFQVLPTLQSRIGYESVSHDSQSTTAWQVFVAATYAGRLQQIDSWHKSKDQQWLTAIAHGLHTMKLQGLDVVTLQAIETVGQKLQTRGASNKMLLEHLALVLPLTK
jgi:hypothetical protein